MLTSSIRHLQDIYQTSTIHHLSIILNVYCDCYMLILSGSYTWSEFKCFCFITTSLCGRNQTNNRQIFIYKFIYHFCIFHGEIKNSEMRLGVCDNPFPPYRTSYLKKRFLRFHHATWNLQARGKFDDVYGESVRVDELWRKYVTKTTSHPMLNFGLRTSIFIVQLLHSCGECKITLERLQ